MASDWIMLILPKVFTKIKTEFSQTIKDTYKMTDKSFSTVGSSGTPAVFPFVFVQLLPATEQGQDIEGTSINGGMFTFQVDIIDNQSQSNARKSMTEIVRIMKTMGFNVNSMPSFQNTTDNTHRMTARFMRLIGESDTL